MPIVLDPKTESLIREKFESGLYADTDEALREAVHLLDERDRLHQGRQRRSHRATPPQAPRQRYAYVTDLDKVICNPLYPRIRAK